MALTAPDTVGVYVAHASPRVVESSVSRRLLPREKPIESAAGKYSPVLVSPVFESDGAESEPSASVSVPAPSFDPEWACVSYATKLLTSSFHSVAVTTKPSVRVDGVEYAVGHLPWNHEKGAGPQPVLRCDGRPREVAVYRYVLG